MYYIIIFLLRQITMTDKYFSVIIWLINTKRKYESYNDFFATIFNLKAETD